MHFVGGSALGPPPEDIVEGVILKVQFPAGGAAVLCSVFGGCISWSYPVQGTKLSGYPLAAFCAVLPVPLPYVWGLCWPRHAGHVEVPTPGRTEGPTPREHGSEAGYRRVAKAITTWFEQATCSGFLAKPKALRARYPVSGSISKVKRRFLICPNETGMGTCHCSTMPNYVQVGGVVGNLSRLAWFT